MNRKIRIILEVEYDDKRSYLFDEDEEKAVEGKEIPPAILLWAVSELQSNSEYDATDLLITPAGWEKVEEPLPPAYQNGRYWYYPQREQSDAKGIAKFLNDLCQYADTIRNVEGWWCVEVRFSPVEMEEFMKMM